MTMETTRAVRLAPLDANRVYDVLVRCAGASDDLDARVLFVQAQVRGCEEYRFGGWLGSGGKFRNVRGNFYVDCYPEDSTPERVRIVAETNRELEACLTT